MTDKVGLSGGNDVLDAPEMVEKDSIEHTYTVGESTLETLIGRIGWCFDEFGFVVDESDNLVTDTKGRPIMQRDVGGVAIDQDGEPVPLRDNFVDVVDYTLDKWISAEEEINMRDRSVDIREVE